jgi:hypothetical protein
MSPRIVVLLSVLLFLFAAFLTFIAFSLSHSDTQPIVNGIVAGAALISCAILLASIVRPRS